jgi:hypothetical protein
VDLPTPPSPSPSPVADAGAPSPWGIPPEPPGCAICGSVPAADVTFTQGIGMVILRRTKTVRVRACRDCGTALFRKTQSQTLLTGWWGVISAFTNLGYVWGNFQARKTLDALGDPRPPRERTAQTPRTTPLPVGSPTLLRPQPLVFFLFVVGLTVFALATDPEPAASSDSIRIGTCAEVQADEIHYPVSCNGPTAAARLVAVLPAATASTECPASSDGWSRSPRFGLLCWARV